jgi:hypothetical protein
MIGNRSRFGPHSLLCVVHATVARLKRSTVIDSFPKTCPAELIGGAFLTPFFLLSDSFRHAPGLSRRNFPNITSL